MINEESLASQSQIARLYCWSFDEGNINDEEEPKKVHLITIDEATQLVEGITKYQLRKLIKSREIPSILKCSPFVRQYGIIETYQLEI